MKKKLIMLIVLGLLIISMFLMDFRIFFKQTCLEACNEKGFSNAKCGKHSLVYMDVDKERNVINGTIPCKLEAWILAVENSKRGSGYALEEFSDCHNKQPFGITLLRILLPRAGSTINFCCCYNQ